MVKRSGVKCDPSLYLKLTRKTDSYRGGGMMGAVSIDLGLDDSALGASFVMGRSS